MNAPLQKTGHCRLEFLVAWLAWVVLASAVTAAPPSLRATPFALSDVRLLAGPFKEGQDLSVTYLLSFEPDRFLANFRKEAGLPPKAEHYGGWESQGVSGHSAGHYLSACAMAYAATNDQRFLDRVNYMVDELAACQDALGTGYVAAIPDGKRVYAEVAAGNIRSAGFDLNGCWVPNYTLHKLLAGLRDAYRLCGNAKALDIAKKLADWFEKTLEKLDESQIQTDADGRARGHQRDVCGLVRRYRRSSLPGTVASVSSQGHPRPAGTGRSTFCQENTPTRRFPS